MGNFGKKRESGKMPGFPGGERMGLRQKIKQFIINAVVEDLRSNGTLRSVIRSYVLSESPKPQFPVRSRLPSNFQKNAR